MKKENLITAFGAILLMPPLFCFPFEYWTYKSMRGYSVYAEKIFLVYGFPKPDVFDARKGITFFENNGNVFFAMNYELALKKTQVEAQDSICLINMRLEEKKWELANSCLILVKRLMELHKALKAVQA